MQRMSVNNHITMLGQENAKAKGEVVPVLFFQLSTTP
jgi:hypothetical protein